MTELTDGMFWFWIAGVAINIIIGVATIALIIYGLIKLLKRLLK